MLIYIKYLYLNIHGFLTNFPQHPTYQSQPKK